MECSVRCGGVALCPMQLGCPASCQRQRSSQAWQGEIRQFEVNYQSVVFPVWILHFLIRRYEYDDHYFLTDPKEFIYEFYPLQSEWQLLKNPITLEEFEELPFVRSLFFRYQLSFPSDNMKSVMHTDSTGNSE